MTNDLTLIENINKQLRKPREEKDNIFPLSATHRKELRELKKTNISSITSRLSYIRKIKTDEFMKKYDKIFETELKKHDHIIQKLNNLVADMYVSIEKHFAIIKEAEKECNREFIQISSGYGSIGCLNIEKEDRRRYSISKNAMQNMIRDRFDEAFGKRFGKVQEIINTLSTQYEEAINFGDLELVKKLYYQLKDADTFLTSISEMKV